MHTPTIVVIDKKSNAFIFFGLNFKSIEYKAQSKPASNTHKSPLVNCSDKNDSILPFKIRYITPNVDNYIPIICVLDINVFKITAESMTIIIGVLEFISKALIAVVVCKP